MDEPHNLAQQSAPEKPHRTRGDRLFDRIVYAGLNGVGTFLLTIPLAYWGDHGGGKEFFEKMGQKAATVLKRSPETAKTIVRATTLGLGGTVMVIPVFFAEHFRTPMVNWLNRNFGNEQDKATPVENPAPQTFASLIKGRLVAWCAVFSGFKIVEYVTKWADHPKALENFEERFAKAACKIVKADTHVAGVETKAFRYGKLAALDVFATAAATTILYVSSRFFARSRSPEKQKELATQAASRSDILRDEAGQESAALSGKIEAAPQPVIAGEKIHPGMVAADAVRQVGA